MPQIFNFCTTDFKLWKNETEVYFMKSFNFFYYLAGAIVTAVRTVIFTTGTNEIHLFNPVFMDKFIPHATEYARSVIDLVTIYVSF